MNSSATSLAGDGATHFLTGGRKGVGHAPGQCGICAGAGARGSSRARFNWLIVQEWNCTYIIRCRQTVCMPSMDTDRTPETCSRASIEQSGPPHDIRSEIAYERTGRGTLCGESPGPTAQSKALGCSTRSPNPVAAEVSISHGGGK